MGRDLHWYVIPKKIEHDKTKQICLDYEFQGDEQDIKYEVYEKITNESPLFDYERREGESHKEYYERKKAFEDNVDNVNYDYKYEKKHRDKWCPKCHTFVKGLYDSVALLDDTDIHHSYSSLYWGSKWNIKDMYLGLSDTEFINLFRNDNMYREVTQDDVKYAYETIKRLGTPLRKSDIEACEETMSILNFLDKWTKNDDVYVIMEDEV
jgi:hypothetical protein